MSEREAKSSITPEDVENADQLSNNERFHLIKKISDAAEGKLNDWFQENISPNSSLSIDVSSRIAQLQTEAGKQYLGDDARKTLFPIATATDQEIDGLLEEMIKTGWLDGGEDPSKIKAEDLIARLFDSLPQGRSLVEENEAEEIAEEYIAGGEGDQRVITPEEQTAMDAKREALRQKWTGVLPGSISAKAGNYGSR